MVRIITCKEILYETVFPVRLDTRRFTYRCDAKLSYNKEYFRRFDMVSRLYKSILFNALFDSNTCLFGSGLLFQLA